MRVRSALFLLLMAATAAAAATPPVPAGKPDAVIDLATRDGAALVKGQWRYSDTRIVETDFRAAGADGQPSGTPVALQIEGACGHGGHHRSAKKEHQYSTLPHERHRPLIVVAGRA